MFINYVKRTGWFQAALLNTRAPKTFRFSARHENRLSLLSERSHLGPSGGLVRTIAWKEIRHSLNAYLSTLDKRRFLTPVQFFPGLDTRTFEIVVGLKYLDSTQTSVLLAVWRQNWPQILQLMTNSSLRLKRSGALERKRLLLRKRLRSTFKEESRSKLFPSSEK